MSRRICIPLVLAALMVPIAVAQDNSSNNNDRERRGGPGGGDPAAFRQQMMDRIKERAGVTNEDEWKVIQGKLDPVMTKRMEVMAGGMGGFGRGGFSGRRGGDDNDSGRQRSPIEQASRDLATALEDKSASDDVIKEKLTALREARDKARADLAALQKDLKEVLAPGRQEAAMVSYGFID